MLQGGFDTLWSLVAQSGLVAQVVLLILLFFSLLSWAIIFKKVRSFREVDRQSALFYERFRTTSSLSDIYRDCQNFPMSPLAGIFKSGYEELNHQMEVMQNEAASEQRSRTLLKSLNGLQRSLQKAAVAEMATLERSLSWLATTGAVTPFIGLFGTVVGIINAFRGLGEGTGTTIQAVAPGISEALVATAAGLFAAIPAVIAYNHFLSRLKIFGSEMDDFSAQFLNLIERNFT
ncbi:MAG: protein TolQ [Acidobacteria bacterium]|nr:protein TolQ [Acidobacteriota bacterium]